MKNRLWLGMALTLLAGAVAAGWAADWAQWRGPDANGIAPDTGINKDWAARPPKTLWQVPLSDEGCSGPSVANGKVFIIDHQGEQDIVRALQVENGEEVWRYAYAETSKANFGFACSTPTINEGKVYTLGRLGQLNCLEENTGKLLWARNILEEFGGKRPSWNYCMSPLVDDNKVIIEPGGANLVAALDKNTGQTLWVGGGSDTPGYATPVVATLQGVKQYLILSAAGVRGLSAENGQVLWQHPWKTYADVNVATPLVTGNQVFITSGYGAGCVMLEISAQGPRVLWQNKEMEGQFISPVLYGGFLWGAGAGKFVGLNLATGQGVFQSQDPGFGINQRGGSALGVDGVLLVLAGGNGDLYMLTPANPPQVLGKITPLGGDSLTAPIMADGKLIIRNTKMLAYLDMK